MGENSTMNRLQLWFTECSLYRLTFRGCPLSRNIKITGTSVFKLPVYFIRYITICGSIYRVRKWNKKKKHLTPASLEIAVITVEPVGRRDYSVNKMEKDPLASFIGQKALIIANKSYSKSIFFKSFWYCTLFRSWCPSGRKSGNFIPQKVGDVILKPAPNRSRTMSGSYYFN